MGLVVEKKNRLTATAFAQDQARARDFTWL
jgi:hypothetical protein